MKNGSIRRWVPLIAVAYIAVITIAQAFGFTGFADQVRAIGGLIDLEAQSPVSSSELLAAVAAVSGVVLKILRTWGLIAAAERAARSAPGPLALLVLCVGSASAQTVDKAPAPSVGASFACSIHSGAIRYVARGRDEDNLTTRVGCWIKGPAGITVFGRGDITRTQDGGELTDPKTFRSFEVMGGIRRGVMKGLELGVLAGTTYSIDGAFDPSDARLWTMAAFARLSIMGEGYILAGAGHHGPVGGPAAIASVVIPRGDKAALFVDAAVPLSRAGLALNPYTIKTGAAICVRWC